MTTGQKGIDLIKHYETLRLKSYYCPAGKLTVGYGHTGRDVSEGMVITEKKAEDLLRSDVMLSELAIKKYVKITLNQDQFDALVSFVFNCGGEALRTSTLLTLLNAGDIKGAALEFRKWIHSNGKVLNGLKNRRATESTLFLTGNLKLP